MNKFDKYYKRKNVWIPDEVVNRYMKYDNKHLLISNGYSVIYSKTIRNDFKELENKEYYKGICDFYNSCVNKDKFEIVKTLKLSDIKNNLEESITRYNIKMYEICDRYYIDYLSLRKIVDIIGCEEVNIMKNVNLKYDYVIEIVGKDNQNGYLLPSEMI